MTDEKLLELLRTEPEKGLRSAVSIYGTMVERVVRQRLPQASHEDIEETVSDSFVLLFRNLGKVDTGKGSLGAYLSVIARNTALRRAGQLSRRREAPLEELEMAAVPDHRELYDALMSLPEQERRLIVMRYFYGLSNREIAVELGISEDAARKRVTRALDRLRMIFREEGV